MKPSQKLLSHLRKSEGLALEAYPDPGSRNGHPWTIGYGHTGDVVRGMTCTKYQAEKWLLEDVNIAASAIERLVRVPLNDNQKGALVSFVFNIGMTAFRESTLLRKLNRGDYDAVPEQLMRWVYNDGKRMGGLVTRRAAEVDLWLDPEPGPATEAKPAQAVSKKRVQPPPDGRPLAKSSTAWSAVGGVAASVLGAMQGLDPLVGGAVILVSAAFAAWIIRERWLKSREHGI